MTFRLRRALRTIQANTKEMIDLLPPGSLVKIFDSIILKKHNGSLVSQSPHDDILSLVQVSPMIPEVDLYQIGTRYLAMISACEILRNRCLRELRENIQRREVCCIRAVIEHIILFANRDDRKRLETELVKIQSGK